MHVFSLIMHLQSIEMYNNEATQYDISSKAEFYV